MKLQFDIKFKKGPKVVGEINGLELNNSGDLTLEELTTKVLETEQFLEKLTGLRVHVEQVY